MAATSDIFCDNCAFQDLSRLAIKWCPECEQGLCTDCIQHHTGFKLSRNHVTIDIANYKKLPDFFSSIKLSCGEHNEKFQLFCPSHNVPCCGQCVFTSHTDCKGLFSMTEILKNAKTSSALEAVEVILNAIRKNIEIIVKARAQNLKDIQSQFQNVKDVVNETRERIITNLDILENGLLEEIRNRESKFTNETEQILKEMGDKDLEVQEYQENIKAIKEYGTDIHTFFGTREIAGRAEAEEQRINAYFEDGTLKTNKLQFKLHENLDKFLNAKSFGYLLLETTKSFVSPVQAKCRAAQIGTPVSRMRSVGDIRVKIKTKFRVSSGKEEISITSNICFGVTCLDGKVISAIYTKGIYTYDTGNNLATKIRKDILPFKSYVTCFQGRIYYTNTDDNSVTCLNPNGDVLWKFIDKSVLQKPRSIATDQHGNVFVSSVGNNSIVAISADGKHGRVILTGKDGISNAWAMCYDKLSDKLVVVNRSGDVFVFDIV